MSEIDVIGVGNAIVDILAKCGDETLTQLDLPKGHMQLISADEADQLYKNMGPATEISGGSAANTCAGIGAFGGNTGFVGVISDDQFGKIFAHDLNAQGVTFKSQFSGNDKPTARSLIFITPDGERTMNTYLGSCVDLSGEHINEGEISAAKITYLEGYLFDPPQAKEAFYKAASTAKQAERQVALSLSDAFCVERHRDDFMRFINEYVDVLFANEEEIIALYQSTSFEEAVDEARNSVGIAALTQGAKGSRIVAGEDTYAVDVERVENVVDTTGAGDLYAAGVLYGLTQGHPFEVCGKLGSLAAAEIISHIGARPEQDLGELARSRNLT